MKSKLARLAVAMAMVLPLCAAAGDQDTLAGQTPPAVALTSEPHHHFAFGNEYVKLFKVEVPSHEATLLHQHDGDYLYITLGDAQVTSTIPGKPEAHLKLTDGSVGFSRGGFAHVARTDGDTPFRNDTIELLHPQGELRNLCLQVVANEHAACPGTQAPGEATHTDWPEFETDETRVVLTRALPHREVTLHDTLREELIVAVDEAVLAFAAGKGPERLLRPGDFVWIERGGVTRVIKNNSDKETRYIALEMKPHASPETPRATGPPLMAAFSKPQGDGGRVYSKQFSRSGPGPLNQMGEVRKAGERNASGETEKGQAARPPAPEPVKRSTNPRKWTEPGFE